MNQPRHVAISDATVATIQSKVNGRSRCNGRLLTAAPAAVPASARAPRAGIAGRLVTFCEVPAHSNGAGVTKVTLVAGKEVAACPAIVIEDDGSGMLARDVVTVGAQNAGDVETRIRAPFVTVEYVGDRVERVAHALRARGVMLALVAEWVSVPAARAAVGHHAGTGRHDTSDTMPNRLARDSASAGAGKYQ